MGLTSFLTPLWLVDFRVGVKRPQKEWVQGRSEKNDKTSC